MLSRATCMSLSLPSSAITTLSISIVLVRNPLFNQTVRSFAISAKLIKELREMTSAPMLDCKKALESPEVNGDLNKAVDYLRKQGLKKVTKVEKRNASQGVIASCIKDNKGVLIELNSETDFVSRNEYFQTVARNIVETVCSSDKTKLEEVNELKMINDPSRTVGDSVKEAIGKIGENIVLRRVNVIQAPENGFLSLYTHNNYGSSLSQIASIVACKCQPAKGKTINQEMATEIAHKVAMHIVASNPLCTSIENVPKDALERERAVIKEQIPKDKPQNLQEKMINGKLSSFYKQCVLLEQPFVLVEGTPSVQKYLKSCSKDLGGQFVVDQFIRMKLGETKQ